MRLPVVVALVAVGLVAFKIITIGSLAMAAVVVLPLAITFAVVGVIMFCLVGSLVVLARFAMYCLRGFQPRRPPAPHAYPPRPAASPMPPPYAYRVAQQRLQERYMRRRVRRPLWRPVIAVLMLIAFVSWLGSRDEPARSGRDGRHVSERFAAAEAKVQAKLSQTKAAISRRMHRRPPEPAAPAPEPPKAPELPPVVEAAPVAPAPDTKLAAAEATVGPVDPASVWTDEGRGESAADAEAAALENAEKDVVKYLHAQDPPVLYRPSRQYIREHLIREKPELLTPLELGPGLGRAQQVRLKVEVPAKELAHFVANDRRSRLDDRLFLLAKLLGEAVAVLGTVAVYIRLDERSRGAYRAWLSVAAAAVTSAVSIMLWAPFPMFP